MRLRPLSGGGTTGIGAGAARAPCSCCFRCRDIHSQATPATAHSTRMTTTVELPVFSFGGVRVGNLDGRAKLGAIDGDALGPGVASTVGLALGTGDGNCVGRIDGRALGTGDGSLVGKRDG